MTSSPLSRRGIVGFIAALSTAPRAVASQAVDALKDRQDELKPPRVPYLSAETDPKSAPLDPAQLLLQAQYKAARKKANARRARIDACRSMSRLAKRAYHRIAEEESAPLYIKWAQAMGWRAPNDETDDDYY